MARVPDLGSDFSQKLLQDLRRRRERLGFESAAAPRMSNAAPRDAYSNYQKPLRSQEPQHGAPRVGRPEATTHRSYQQSSNGIVRDGKPRHRDTPVAHSHDIVTVQGGGSKQKPANNIDVQMALALALSNSGKLQNIELVVRNSSIFFREPDRMQMHHRRDDNLLSPNVHVGKVAIGVQKLNEILMAYSSGASARDFSRRNSVEIGKQMFRGAMDLEESLSMLVKLQEASDYMEGSGNGKVLLLKEKENLKSSTHSSSSARPVEISYEDSETEQAKNGRSSSNASMQIVAHKKPQSYSTNSNSVLQLSTIASNSNSNVYKGEKDNSKVRMPNVIAKLMGLEKLPSVKVVAEHKGTEKFVKPKAVARKEIRANVMVDKLPIRIVASERMLVKGQNKHMPAGECKIGLANSEESESAIALSNSSSIPTTDKRTRQTMKQVLRKIENTVRREREIQGVNEKISKTESTVRRGVEIQGVNEKIIPENKKLTEESKLQKAVSVECRTDAGRKMDFLKRFRKNSENKPVTEEKPIIQEKNRTIGKKQATSMKQLLGRGSNEKSRRTREEFNKETLATTEIKAAGKNGKTDQMRRQTYNKQIDKQRMAQKVQNYREMQSETAKNLEGNKTLKSEATHMNKKFAYTELRLQENDTHTKVNDIGVSKPSDSNHSTHGVGGISEQPSIELKDSNTTGVASSGQSVMQITKEIIDQTMAIVQASVDSKVLDQSATAEINEGGINHTASEITLTIETFTEGERHKQMIVKAQPMDGLDHTTLSSSPAYLQDHKMHVVTCDSFTENQLLLMTMLLKDQYLLETAKEIVRIRVPVNFVNASAGKWSDKSNDLLSDVGREVIRRKGKRTEAMVEVSMACTVNLKLQYLDDLIRELDVDIESLNISRKPYQQSGDSTAGNLQMILHRDIQNNHPDANSMWDFGWNRISDLPVEKNEVVKDLEKNILGGIITDVARELIEVSLRHGCCSCEA